MNVNPTRGDIYLAKFTWNDCKDPRPVIVLDVLNDGKIRVAPLSSALGLYRAGKDFYIDERDPDFAATGLDRDSFVIDEKIRVISLSNLLIRFGRLEGQLALKFWRWLG